MEWSIGATKGKCCCIHNDLYAGGERSGKYAKPNVLSAAANAHAHADMPITIMPPSATAPPSAHSVCGPPFHCTPLHYHTLLCVHSCTPVSALVFACTVIYFT